MAANEEQTKLLDPPAVSRAAVWKQFGFEATYDSSGVATPDKSKVICKHFRIAMKYSGNTTNLTTHMQRRHPDVHLAKSQSGRSQTATGSGEFATSSQPKLNFDNKLKFTSARSQAITRSIADFIVKDLRPLSVVENEGFKRMIYQLEPRYKIPSRPNFSDKAVPEIYSQVMDDLKHQLKAAKSVSVTTDGWTSRNTESYVTVTYHFITADWNMQSYVLETELMNESHTAQNVADVLIRCLQDWDIKEKTFSVVTDNSSNMVAAMKLLPYHPMRCFAHTLNIASQKALKIPAASKVLAKIRRTVSFFHKSSIATNVLKEKQVLLNLPEHKLKIDVSTRWNSSYEMIERYLEQQPAVHAAMLSKEIRKSQRNIATFADSDLSVAEDILGIMRPMKIATVALREDTGPTISMVNPLYNSTVVWDMKQVMLADLQPRYKDDHDFLMTASALDPRFKGLPFVDDLVRHQIFSQLAVNACEVADLVQVKTEPEDAQDGMVAEGPPLPMLQLPDDT